MQFCWERERAAMLGMRILCSVSLFPSTLSPNWLSISAGKGSLAPKSPKKSLASTRTMVLVLRSDFEVRVIEWGDGLRWVRKIGCTRGNAMLSVAIYLSMFACLLGWLVLYSLLDWVEMKMEFLVEMMRGVSTA